MAQHVHQISERQHARLLEEERRDPVTGEPIRAGDEVVFCAGCGSAFALSSWKYLERRHCGQYQTLPRIPSQNPLTLKRAPARAFQSNASTSTAAVFDYATRRERFMAAMLDVIILSLGGFFGMITIGIIGRMLAGIGALSLVVMLVSTGMLLAYGLTIDHWLGGASPGKHLMKLRVVHAENGTRCTAGQALLRMLTLLIEPLSLIVLLANRRSLADQLSRTIVVRS